jgi:dihydroorotate dehydrogenase
MIPISDNRFISNLCISTALGHSGSGMFPYTLMPVYRWLMRVTRSIETTVFSKSSTRFYRVGNFVITDPKTWHFVQRIKDSETGMLNAYGLTNQGVEAESRKMILAGKKGYSVVPNFFPEFVKESEVAIRETLEAMEILSKALGGSFDIVELNYSCPNSAECMLDNIEACSACTRAVRAAYPNLFVIAKVGYRHPYEFCEEQERAGASALHAINTIPFADVYGPKILSPLADVGGGGVSGGPAKQLAYEYNEGLGKRVSLPLVFGCGVENFDDYLRYFDIGASAVSVCSAAIRTPGRTAQMIKMANRPKS